MTWQKTFEGFTNNDLDVGFNGQEFKVTADKGGRHGYTSIKHIPMSVVVELLMQYGYCVKESGQ